MSASSGGKLAMLADSCMSCVPMTACVCAGGGGGGGGRGGVGGERGGIHACSCAPQQFSHLHIITMSATAPQALPLYRGISLHTAAVPFL